MNAKDEIKDQQAKAEAAAEELAARKLSARKHRLTDHLPDIGTHLPKTRSAQKSPKRAGPLGKKAAAKSLARFGFEGGDVIRFWPDIAGERLARVTKPERIKRTPQGDVLVIKVSAAAAMEVQHKVAELLERANRIAGSGKLARIEIIQGPVR